MELEEANSLLPTEKVGVTVNPAHLVYTIIAEPKWGKTTWATRFPDSVLLAFEQGHSFIEAHKIIMDAWHTKSPEVYQDGDGIHHMTFLHAIDIICASDRFETVVIDTADMMAKMCLDFNLRLLGIKHPSDLDFGKGYETALNTPFRQAVGKIIKSGRGVVFITHTETKDARFSSGTKTRKECTLPGGVVKFVIPQSDVVLHGKFGIMNNTTKKRDRILVTEGSDDMLAGARVQGKFRLPTRFVVDPNDPWAQWARFFEDPNAADEADALYATNSRAPRSAQYEEASQAETGEVPAEEAPKRQKSRAR